ncbi:Vacuolar protein sorting-associated protein 62 [Ceratobasidium sp. 428]|nr:Vacuolar protein sorting-associated protein 62 [Ceratobasidium sp. 428]
MLRVCYLIGHPRSECTDETLLIVYGRQLEKKQYKLGDDSLDETAPFVEFCSIAMYSSLLIVSALVGQALGVLTPELIALAQKYAPQFRLTPTEKYFPSSVEYMLPHYQVYKDDSQTTSAQPSSLTVSNLNAVTGGGTGAWLTVPDTNASYLAGLNPASNKVPVIFFPFNLGKDIVALGRVGNHIGDWERMTVRTVNGAAISVDYNAHASGNGAGTKRWVDVLKPPGEDRPLGYVADGSHGVWPEPGTWVYEDFIIVQLKDETADGGPTWHAKDNIYAIEYLPNATYTGDQAWVNYQGFWGNIGQTDCWWYSIVKVNLPAIGRAKGQLSRPYRQDVLAASFASTPMPRSKFSHMRGPHSQTLAPLANNLDMSLYKFRLDSSALRLIDLESSNYVAVEQECIQTLADATITSSNYGFSKLAINGEREYSISVSRCPSNSGYVDSYRVGLCTTSETATCSWAPPRQLRTYLANRPGVVRGPAVELDMDHDNWMWN